MGTHWPTREHRAEQRRLQQEAARVAESKRMALADKIVFALVDEISNAIVRPGPKPEERECYVMAQELRDHSPHLKNLVASILAIEAQEGE